MKALEQNSCAKSVYLKEKYGSIRTPESDMMGMYEVYMCPKCGRLKVVRYRDSGFAPDISCVNVGCESARMVPVQTRRTLPAWAPQSMVVELYRPTLYALEKMDLETVSSVLDGFLLSSEEIRGDMEDEIVQLEQQRMLMEEELRRKGLRCGELKKNLFMSRHGFEDEEPFKWKGQLVMAVKAVEWGFTFKYLGGKIVKYRKTWKNKF